MAQVTDMAQSSPTPVPVPCLLCVKNTPSNERAAIERVTCDNCTEEHNAKHGESPCAVITHRRMIEMVLECGWRPLLGCERCLRRVIGIDACQTNRLK